LHHIFAKASMQARASEPVQRASGLSGHRTEASVMGTSAYVTS